MNMIRYTGIVICLALLPGPAGALGKSDIRKIVEAAYPGASISEIEKERYKGIKVYEVDFKHEGQALEAIIGLDGEIIKVQVDD